MGKYLASIYNLLFNSLNSIIVIINGIVLVPLYFHFFPVSVYGAWLASGNLVAMIGIIESEFSTVITQKLAFALSSGNDKEYRTLAGANILSAIIISITLFLVSLCVAPFVAEIVNVGHEYASDIRSAFILSALSASIMIFVNLFGAFPQVWQETKAIGLLNTIGNIIAIISLVIFLFSGFGVVSLGLSYVVRSMFNLSSQGIWIIKKWIKRGESKIIYSILSVYQLSKACFYPFLSRLTNVIMGHSTSLIIAFFLTPTLSAVFDITGKIAMCLFGFLNIANGSFFGLFSLTISKGDKKEVAQVINKVTCLISGLITAVIIYSSCFSKEFIYWWVGLDKFGGLWLLFAIVFANAITRYKGFFNTLLFAAGKINKASVYDILSLIMYVLCLLATFWLLGIYAIPVSMATTNAVFLIIYLFGLKNTLGITIKHICKYIIYSLAYPVIIIACYLLLGLEKLEMSELAIFLLTATIFTLGYVFLNFESRKVAKSIFIKTKSKWIERKKP